MQTDIENRSEHYGPGPGSLARRSSMWQSRNNDGQLCGLAYGPICRTCSNLGGWLEWWPQDYRGLIKACDTMRLHCKTGKEWQWTTKRAINGIFPPSHGHAAAVMGLATYSPTPRNTCCSMVKEELVECSRKNGHKLCSICVQGHWLDIYWRVMVDVVSSLYFWRRVRASAILLFYKVEKFKCRSKK